MFTKSTYLNTDKREHEEWEISHCTVFVYKKYIFEHRQKITWRMRNKSLYSVCLQKVHIWTQTQKITSKVENNLYHFNMAPPLCYISVDIHCVKTFIFLEVHSYNIFFVITNKQTNPISWFSVIFKSQE